MDFFEELIDSRLVNETMVTVMGRKREREMAMTPSHDHDVHSLLLVEEKIMPFPLRQEDLLKTALYTSTEFASPNRCADVEREGQAPGDRE